MRPYSSRLAALLGVGALTTFCGVEFQSSPDGSTGGSAASHATGSAGDGGVGGSAGGTAAGAPSGPGGSAAQAGGDHVGGRGAQGGAGGGGPCLACAEAFDQPQLIAPSQVCAGAERDNYIALHDCICDSVSSCPSCGDYCSNVGPATSSCIDCIDNNAPCDGPGADCGVPNF